ncbi:MULTISPECIES: oligosaccharide flippase family protein [unclassified Moraxella]|uniref:oligosaccharide flippase family protein n=1 Tax=unclassified Moraxella TaxID=2685852 RepID=UPI003AF56635
MLTKIQTLAKSALLKDSLVYVMGEMTAKAVPFLLLPYLTRQLGTAGFGSLSYYTAVTAFLLIFVSLSQSGALTRYYYVYGKHGLGNVLVAGGVYSAIVWGLASVICGLLGDELLLYACLTALFQSLVQNQLALRQCQKRPLSYFAIQISLALSNVLFTVLMFQLIDSDKVALRLLAVALSFCLTFIGALWLAKRQFGLRFAVTPRRFMLGFRYLLLFGFPLLFHALSYTVKGQFDRLMIYQQFSSEALGVYSAGVQIASSVSIVIMAINSASVPYLYEKLKKNTIRLAQLQRWFWLSFAIAPVLAGVAWLVPKAVFAWVLGANFADSQYYTAVFVGAFSLTIPYLLLVNFLFYHAKNRQIATASVLSTLIYLAMLWVTSRMALSYVPLATIVSNVAILPFLYYFSLQVNQEKISK